MSRPKILVTGFANSGTSFMCELVAATGFSAGSPENLKAADGHNPHGYWEHLPIRHLVWGQTGNFNERRIPKAPINAALRGNVIGAIQHVAMRDNVEVYKDCTGPWSYPLLPGVEKVVLMRRDLDTLYERYYKSAGWGRQEIARGHTAYYDLAAKYLEADLPALVVPYEAYAHEPKSALWQLCKFLDRPYDTQLLSVYRPRRPQ